MAKYGLVAIATSLYSETPVSKCVQTEGHLATVAQSSKADTAKDASRVYLSLVSLVQKGPTGHRMCKYLTHIMAVAKCLGGVAQHVAVKCHVPQHHSRLNILCFDVVID